MFFKKNLPIKFLDSFGDNNGNILSVLVELEGRTILIQGVYSPNRDNSNFYSEECFKQDLVFSVKLHFGLNLYPLSLPLVPYSLVLFLSQNLGDSCDSCHSCHSCDCPLQK